MFGAQPVESVNGREAQATAEPLAVSNNDLVIIVHALRNNRYTADEFEQHISPLLQKIQGYLHAQQGGHVGIGA